MEGLEIDITPEALKEGSRNAEIFAEALLQKGFKPSTLGPIFVAALKSTDGFPLCYLKQTVIISSQEALTLRAAYEVYSNKYDAGHVGKNAFRNAVLPGFFKLAAEVKESLA
jgi:hypothetical protein